MHKQDTKEQITRRAGVIGICVNIFLCSIKLFIGYITNSIAILSDGFNNLTDIVNALFVYLGYRISNRHEDSSHPFGYGRLEYMLSQAIAFMIMIVGITLCKTSIDRLLHPQKITLNTYVLLMMCFSLVVKLSLAHYYGSKYRQTSIELLKAQKIDSLADSASIFIIILGIVLTPFTDFPVDSFIGIIVSILIIYSGIRIFMDMSSILLGRSTDSELYEKISAYMTSQKNVLGFHDLIIHSYGANKLFGTCDVELDGRMSLIESHTIIDTIEDEILGQYGVQMTIHADPVMEDAKEDGFEKALVERLKEVDERINYHDYHYNENVREYHLDIELPYDMKDREEEMKDIITAVFRKYHKNRKINIKIDHIA